LVKFALSTGNICLSTLVRGESLNSATRNLALKTRETLIYCMVSYIDRQLFRLVAIHAFDRQTDRQTERRQQ